MVNPHTVKAIDKDRLSKLYTTEVDSHRKLKKPMEYSRYLGIDEFKLHNHHQYATAFYRSGYRTHSIDRFWKEKTDCI